MRPDTDGWNLSLLGEPVLVGWNLSLLGEPVTIGCDLTLMGGTCHCWVELVIVGWNLSLLGEPDNPTWACLPMRDFFQQAVQLFYLVGILGCQVIFFSYVVL